MTNNEIKDFNESTKQLLIEEMKYHITVDMKRLHELATPEEFAEFKQLVNSIPLAF